MKRLVSVIGIVCMLACMGIVPANAQNNLLEQRLVAGIAQHEIAQNDVDGMKKLLREGVSVNAKDENQTTLLMHAAKQGKPEIIKLLLDRRAKINAQDKDGRTALTYARWDVIDLLVDHGAKVNLPDKNGKTPLMYSIKAGSIAVEKFLDHGADVNMQDKNGRTALWYAVDGENESAFGILIRSGANANIRDKDGMTVLIYLLANYREWDAFGMFKRIIGSADPNIQAADKTTALTVAIDRLGSDSFGFDRVSSLLEHGADVNLQGKNGTTALMHAAQHPWSLYEVAESLLDRGAKVNTQDKDGKTALMYAAENDKLEMIELLLNHGAKVNIQDKKGRTAIDITLSRAEDDDPDHDYPAYKREYKRIVKILKKASEKESEQQAAATRSAVIQSLKGKRMGSGPIPPGERTDR